MTDFRDATKQLAEALPLGPAHRGQGRRPLELREFKRLMLDFLHSLLPAHMVIAGTVHTGHDRFVISATPEGPIPMAAQE